MAQSLNYLYTHVDAAVAFDFISDLRHAALWDPNTESVACLTPPPIGVGSRFELRARLLGVRFTLPYAIAVYERPTRLVFEGSTTWLRYREEITFTPDTAGTTIVYAANISFRSLLAIANPALSLIYQWIGDSATRGIVPALERAVASAGRTTPQASPA